MYIITPDQMRRAEAEANAMGMTNYALMQNAAAALASAIAENVPRNARGIFLCGSGNNGGDGLGAAKLLADRGMDITVCLLRGMPTTEIAAMELDLLRSSNAKLFFGAPDHERKYDFVCDAVFGTGFHGELPPELADFFGYICSFSKLKVAADVPSGANGLTGQASNGTFPADMTVCFSAVKSGLILPPAKRFCGRLLPVYIGISDHMLEGVGAMPLADAYFSANAVPPRNELSHKGNFGKCMIVAGSDSYSGCAALNTLAALRSGAGIVTLASSRTVIDRNASSVSEATFAVLPSDEEGAISADGLSVLEKRLSGYSVCAAGSGLTVSENTVFLMKGLIELCGREHIPMVIDADGINCIAGCIDIIKNSGCEAVLTPHVGELARLAGVTVEEAAANRLSIAMDLAKKSHAYICAKGMPTYIVSPTGRCAAVASGNGGLSRGGSGDVLTGIIAGLISSNKGHMLYECACAGAYVLGAAADLAAAELSVTGMLPTDAIAKLPAVFKNMGK